MGVPIEHDGRLYLFFGDDSVDNWDPIAWLTTSDPDELEDEAPDINWVLNGAGKFHWLSVEGEGLDNFEVPTGGFSYDGRLYVFIGRNKQENPSRMTESILAVRNDPFWDFRTLKQISSTTGGQILVLQPDGSITPAPFPGLRWMLHISATIVQNGDWPGLPESSGEGLLMFGSSAYRGEANATALEQGSGNVYLAWAPLMPGAPSLQAPIPNADEWKFFVGLLQNGMPEWRKLSEGKDPVCILPTLPAGPRNLGEISVVWYPELRRWILAGSGQAPINVARRPWGPWTPCDWICDASRPDRDAGNGNDPQTGVGLWTTFGVSYAPYLIRRWLQWDRSTRSAKLYFTLSGFDDGPGKPKYQPQLIRSTIRCWS